MLTVELMGNRVRVIGDDGMSVWYPSPQALAEILDSDDSERTALDICENAPMRGEWR